MSDSVVPDSQRHPRIAVIAVHGVADHQPRASARDVSGLLRLCEQKDCYGEFIEQSLPITVCKVKVGNGRQPAADAARPSQMQGPFMQERLGKAPRTEESANELDHGFMRDLLSEYKLQPRDQTYETVRMEGARTDAEGKPQADIHVYEMYWADLSRLGRGFVRVFAELYQLLFRVSDLGRHTLNCARAQEQKNGWWAWAGVFHEFAAGMLTVCIPIINLYILAVLLVTLAGRLHEKWQPLIALGVPCTVLAVGFAVWGGWRLYAANGPSKSRWPWAVLPFVATIGAVVATWRLNEAASQFGFFRLLAIEAALLLLPGLIWWMWQYDKARTGAGAAGTLIGVGALAGMLTAFIYTENSHAGITRVSLNAVEILFAAELAFWGLFFLCQAVMWIATLAAVRRQPDAVDQGAGDAARRVAYTSRFSLAVPATLFLLFTITLWTALGVSCASLLPNPMEYSPIVFHSLFEPSRETVPVGKFLEMLIAVSGTSFFLVGLFLIALALALVAWSLFPAVLAEIRPRGRTDEDTKRLGDWLTQGFWLMRIAGELVFITMAIVMPAALLLQVIHWALDHKGIPEPSWFTPLVNLTPTLDLLSLGMASALTGSTVGLLALYYRLEKLSLGFGPVLDAALDVDNHLRDRPLDQTPRARICARYASLLRHLCNPNDGGKYDAIVIVAHSQGSVITADLLRFLGKEKVNDSDLRTLGDAPPLYLFTMGCPLRQLYSQRFPHLYGWARYTDPAAQPLEKREPDPETLDVQIWVNAYRSGDYVGRYLWRRDDDDERWQSAPTQNGKRREFCIGAGAHTHYWDETAPAIAAQLDCLILEAVQKASRP